MMTSVMPITFKKVLTPLFRSSLSWSSLSGITGSGCRFFSKIACRPEVFPTSRLRQSAFEQEGRPNKNHQEGQCLVARETTKEFWRVADDFCPKSEKAIQNKIKRKQPAKK